ncbi:MAG TPA: hypothetical protein VFZ00_30350 [Solirubrobacter sp.]|nr:hypothetical protein [Solirubrobacter sp.]
MGRQLGLRAGLASAGALIAVAAFTPSAAMAHPCAGTAVNEATSFLSLHTNGWAGLYPTFANEHECVSDGVAIMQYENSKSAADPVEDAVSTFVYSDNLTPVGYSARVVPTSGTGSNAINSDLAFQGKYAYQGTYTGFRILDVSDPANPVQVTNYTGCTTGQGDIVVHGNILVRSWDSPVSAGGAATQSCGGTLVGQGFEGIHIFDISDPENPVMVDVDKNPDNGKQGLRFSQQGMPQGALTGCGSHTATAVPDEARGYLYIYNGGSSGTCQGIDIFKIKISDPADATVVRRAAAGRQCHDNTVLLNGANSYASCAGGNGISMFKFDMTKDVGEEGSVENPTLLWSRPMTGVSIGHSGTFSYDGKTIVFGWEPGGGTSPQCQATSSVVARTLFFLDTETGDTKGTLLHPRPQTNLENCTWHNFNTVPTKGGNYLVSGNYQSGIQVVDFTNPAAPQSIAYADPAPLPKTPTGSDPDGGDWSTYWYNGAIYESDIYRGVMVWKLDNAFTNRAKTFTVANPQTQIGAYEPDNGKPSVSIAAPIAGGEFVQDSAVAADFSCADAELGVESCTGTVADGENIDTSKIGTHTFTVTAIDNAGNETTESVQYVVNAMETEGTPGATVEATLALSLGTAPNFGAFVAGVGATYSASTTANVISTAGDGLLTVSDPSDTATGRLVNGTFSLAAPIMASATSAAGTGSAPAAVGGSAAPTSLLTYSGPTSNDTVTLSFSQAVGQNEALRTGTYSKALTFTLSTTQP